MQNERTHFDALGGQVMIEIAVSELYRRVRADRELDGYFAGIPMRRLELHLSAFLGHALGGPSPYNGRSMREAHAGRGIAAQHFARVARHLAKTLADMGVDDELIGHILGRIAPLQAEIVDQPDASAA
jgi:hemoglobin